MKRSWQGRLLGAVGALALGVGGAAWAQDVDEDEARRAEEARTLDDRTDVAPPEDAGGSGELPPEDAGGSGELPPDAARNDELPPEDAGGSGEPVDEGADWINRPTEVLEQTPGQTESDTHGLIGAESLSTQEPGTGGSGQGMLGDATEVSVPGGTREYRPDLIVAIDGGFDTFTGDLGSVMMGGVGYGIRVGARVWQSVGLDVEYSGSRNGVQREWAPENGAAVSRHALDLVLTGGKTFDSGVRPYAGLGFGVGRFAPNSYAQASFDGDWFTEVPLVAGVDYQVGPVFAGVRGDWRFLMGEEFADDLRGREIHGSMLGLSLNVGGRF